VIPASWAKLASQVSRARQVWSVSQVNKESRDCRVIRDHQDDRVIQEYRAIMDRTERMVTQA